MAIRKPKSNLETIGILIFLAGAVPAVYMMFSGFMPDLEKVSRVLQDIFSFIWDIGPWWMWTMLLGVFVMIKAKTIEEKE